MEWKLSSIDLLPHNIPSRVAAEKVEQKFGGFGFLTIVVHSPDSVANDRVISDLAHDLEGKSLVNFTEFKTESEFYRKHQFLYIRLADLQAIRDRINDRITSIKAKRNPFIVSLDSGFATSIDTSSLNLADLERKYMQSLRPNIGNADGTIRILYVYPSYPLSELNQNRALVNTVRQLVEKHQLHSKVQVDFAGKVFENATSGGILLREIYRIAWLSAGIMLLLLILWFFRHPQAPLIAAVPLGFSLIWTFGFNAIVYGHMNFYTLALGLIIPGLAANHLTHFLSHYADERKRGLGPALAIESTILGTGPAITVVSLASAIAFFSLLLIPLEGLRQFGLVGGFGVLFNWASVVLFLPILLSILQRKHTFRVYGTHKPRIDQEKPQPFRCWTRIILPLIIVTAILGSHGFFPDFEYIFSHVENQKPSQRANDLLHDAGIPSQEPAVVLTRNESESHQLLQKLRSKSAADSTSTILRVMNFASLLPPDQEVKLSLLREIHGLLTPEILAALKGEDSINVAKVMQNWNDTLLTVNDLPQSYRRKFIGRDSSFGQFNFIFPSINTDDGHECRRFANEVRNIQINDSTVLHATSTAILRADMLDLSLPWMGRSIFCAIVGILLVVLLFVRRLYRLAIVILPPLIGFLWFLSALKLLDIPLNAFSAQIFPMLIGISISGSLHLWFQYSEKSTGSLGAIMRHVGPTVIIASGNVMVCFSGLLFSSHPGFRSMGLVAVIGLFCLLVSYLTVFPLLVGWLDWLRYRNSSNN